jgi:hypothetical protein
MFDAGQNFEDLRWRRCRIGVVIVHLDQSFRYEPAIMLPERGKLDLLALHCGVPHVGHTDWNEQIQSIVFLQDCKDFRIVRNRGHVDGLLASLGLE